MEADRAIGGAVSHESQIEQDRCPAATAPAARRRQVVRGARRAEAFGLGRERQAASNDRSATLEFVDGDVDAGAEQRLESGFDSTGADHRLDVAVLAACVAKQLGVNAPRPSEDVLAKPVEEPVVPLAQAGGKARTGVRFRQWAEQIKRQPGEEPSAGQSGRNCV